MESEPQRAATRRQKIFAYLLAWIVALGATNPNGGLIALVYMFPLGLFAFLYPPALRDAGWGPMITAYAVYLTQAVLYFRTKSVRSAILWFVVLIVLLLCNVAGCRRMITAH